MNIEDFLIYFKKYWISQGYFKESKVWNFRDAAKDEFDSMSFKWIDFDIAAENYTKKSWKVYKSCDALIIHEKSIDFIEFKRLYIDRPLIEILDNLKAFDLESKLHDSYDLIKIINNEEVKWSKSRKKAMREMNKCFLFSIKYTWYKPTNKMATQLRILELKSNIENYLLSDNMPDNFVYSFIPTDKLNKYYL